MTDNQTIAQSKENMTNPGELTVPERHVVQQPVRNALYALRVAWIEASRMVAEYDSLKYETESVMRQQREVWVRRRDLAIKAYYALEAML